MQHSTPTDYRSIVLQVSLDESTPLLYHWLDDILPLFTLISALHHSLKRENLLMLRVTYKILRYELPPRTKVKQRIDVQSGHRFTSFFPPFFTSLLAPTLGYSSSR